MREQQEPRPLKIVRIATVAFLLLFYALPGSAQLVLTGEWLEIERGGRTLRAWVARPEGVESAPSIIVIHANRGLDDWTRSVADRLAAEGYIAAAPDLLSGMAPDGGGTAAFADRNAARDGIYALQEEQVLGDLNALGDFLLAMDDSDGQLSVSGFCWGGSRTFWFATERAGLTAAYVFYGTAPEDAAAMGRVDAEVYGFYGGEDNRVNSTIDRTAAAMTAAGKTYAPVIYDGAGHGFLARGEQAEEGDPNQVAATLAWERWRDLLARYGTR